MQIQQYALALHQQMKADTVKKQCKMCGKVTTFTDTTIRRHNANGKNIYQFAIYKCPKNHSWNKKLNIYKSFTEHVDPLSIIPTSFIEIEPGKKITSMKRGDSACEIQITSVNGIFRLDRTLADHLEGWSRTEIAQNIKAGKILLNNCLTKPSQKLSVHDKIFIDVK